MFATKTVVKEPEAKAYYSLLFYETLEKGGLYGKHCGLVGH